MKDEDKKKGLFIILIALCILSGAGGVYLGMKNTKLLKAETASEEDKKEVSRTDMKKDEKVEKAPTSKDSVKKESGDKEADSSVAKDKNDSTSQKSDPISKSETKTADASKKPSSSSDSKKPSSGSSSSASKPSGGSSSSSKPSGGSSSSKPEESKPAHTHTWVKQTKVVHHEATGHNEQVLVKAAWTESVPIYETVCLTICNACGADITGNPTPHVKQHALAGENAGHHAEYVQKQTGTQTINHPAEYTTKWVQDSAAWDETVVTGYKCSCGATK